MPPAAGRANRNAVPVPRVIAPRLSVVGPVLAVGEIRVTPPGAIVTGPAVPPKTATAEPPGQTTSAAPLNQLAVALSQVPVPPPVAVTVKLGSQLSVWP